MKLSITLALFISAVSAPSGWCESYTGGDNQNPFANTNTNSNTPPTNSGDAHFFTSTSTIFDDSAGNAQNGREYKLQDATRQANAGQAGAIAAGTALSAAGSAQLAMLNFPEAARLFGLAGLEFAQAGVNSGASSANTGLRTTLLSEAGQTSAQSAYDPSRVAQDLMTPSATAALQAQGIDPSAFFNNLASGNIRSGSDAFTALGQDPSGLSPDAISALNDTGGEDLKGIMDQVGLGVNEGAIFSSSGGPASNLPSGAAGGGSSFGGSDGLNQPSNGGGAIALIGAGAKRGLGPDGGSGASEAASSSHGGLANLLGSFGAQTKDAEAMGGNGGTLNRSDLLAIGIVKAKGQNIFRVANRNYHSFLKWRTLRYPKMKQPAAARGIASIP